MLKALLTALFLLLAGPAWGAITYDTGDVLGVQLDPYLAVFPTNSAGVTCVAFVAMVQLSGATNVLIVANDPDDVTWTKQTEISFGDQVLEAWTAFIPYANATIWSYFAGAGASLDDKSSNVWCGAGVVAIGTNDTASGTSTAPSIALTTQDANNFVVSGFTFVGNKTWTADTGNLRDNYDGGGSQGQSASAVVDNTAASATSVTTSATLSGSDSWAAIAIELRSTLGAGPTRRPIAPIIFQ
jgi:hypothetical protein